MTPAADGPFVFRLNDNGTGPSLLVQVCLERGWKGYQPEFAEKWNLWWRGGPPSSNKRMLRAWQFVNHIPKGASICRKDNLARHLNCMKKIYGSIYDFSPPGYNLPLEYAKLAAECSRSRNKSRSRDDDSEDSSLIGTKGQKIWICKPVGQSQGRGIYLFRRLSDLTCDSNSVVQKYIERPLLIGGYKFDLRLYVCIPTYQPLTVYLYKEGLARFSTDKFSLSDLQNPFRHLTNTSLNKFGPKFAECKDRIGSGCKWTLRQVRRYVSSWWSCGRAQEWFAWQRIAALVVLTALAQAAGVPPAPNCFEFFGFDVLLDADLRPWLLEVNLSPALANDCDADETVKKPLLHDLFDLLGLPMSNTGLSLFMLADDNEMYTDIGNENVRKRPNDSFMDEQRPQRPQIKAHEAKIRRGRARSGQKTRPLPAITLTFPSTNANNCANNYANNAQPQHIDEHGETTRRRKRRTGGEDASSSYTPWGNGRDWAAGAPDRVGGWVKLFPLVDGESEKDQRAAVAGVARRCRSARRAHDKFPHGDDETLNENFRLHMRKDIPIWLPDM